MFYVPYDYHSGALGNYATAIIIKNASKSNNITQKAEEVAKQIMQNLNNVQKKMMILACYFRLYGKRNGYSVTNLGNVENPNIKEAMFIPPASPANKKTMGVLSINRRMKNVLFAMKTSHKHKTTKVQIKNLKLYNKSWFFWRLCL